MRIFAVIAASFGTLLLSGCAGMPAINTSSTGSVSGTALHGSVRAIRGRVLAPRSLPVLLFQGDFDPDELDAPPGSTHGLACYIDMLPRTAEQWSRPALAVEWSKSACAQLRKIPLRSCRADLIVRRAIFDPDTPPDQLDLGVTAYLTACGATETQAAATLASALIAFATTINGHSTVE